MDFSEQALAQTYATAGIKPEHVAEVAQAAAQISTNRPRYFLVSSSFSGMPWWVVGCIHSMESSLGFDKHLHNGDPLTSRTIHYPPGRPTSGEPPFTWEQSAVDALTTVWKPAQWNLGSALHFLEMYNGLGYRKHDIFSPYVWSFTTAYTSGKFVADGSFDPAAPSNQMGSAAIMKALEQSGVQLL